MFAQICVCVCALSFPRALSRALVLSLSISMCISLSCSPALSPTLALSRLMYVGKCCDGTDAARIGAEALTTCDVTHSYE